MAKMETLLVAKQAGYTLVFADTGDQNDGGSPFGNGSFILVKTTEAPAYQYVIQNSTLPPFIWWSDRARRKVRSFLTRRTPSTGDLYVKVPEVGEKPS